MPDYIATCTRHLQSLIAAAEEVGSAMWPAVVDTRTGLSRRDDHVPQRVYRLIGAPRGSTLYWDQPSVVAAGLLDEMTGKPLFGDSVAGYISAFLANCVGADGLFRWGNHAYYDIHTNAVVEFQNGYHELRPITPAWELFWEADADLTARYVASMVRAHIYDPATGGFNRHDDGRKEHAFIESGGVLSESAAWLYAKTGDTEQRETARRVARYSFSKRDPHTGLVPNEPDLGRWDAHVSTSEIGVWAQSVLRAADYTQDEALVDMARQAVAAWLTHAWDPTADAYAGQVAVTDGSHVVAERPGYWPREWANFWNTDQWPQHDYPAAVGEAALTLYGLTGDAMFAEHALRLAAIAVRTAPSRSGHWAYAESYGRSVHLLARAGDELGQPELMRQARELADEGIATLQENGMIQGYTDSHVYEAVDGVGYLMLACLRLDAGRPLALRGFGF